MKSIPANQLVAVIPGVLAAGGNPLSLNSVFLTSDPAVPIDTVAAFADAQDVSDFFGPSSVEAALAAVYFNGFNGATVIAGTLYFAQYNSVAVAGYLRGGSVGALSLAQLQALSGTLIIAVDGATVTSAAINLSAATSPSNAAALMQTGLRTAGGIFSGTASIAVNTLTVATVVTGAIHIGDVIVGAGIAGSTTVTAFLSGTGGTGTYTVSGGSQTVSTEAVTASSTVSVTYDAVREAFLVTSPTTGVNSSVGFSAGTLAAGVKLTSATGAVLSPGAAVATPSSALDSVTTATQNWALFMTTWEPTLDQKLLFADWVTTSQDRYGYVCWDSDVTALAANASGSFGVLTADFDGVIPVWNVDGHIAAFICGLTASINFEETNGRVTYAYKSQPGLTAEITDASVANNLIDNGYNFYGSYATANDQFTFLQPGQISGTWAWIDPYVNQIRFNSDIQLAWVNLLSQVKSVPYNSRGYNLLRAAAQDPINSFLNFGGIVGGVNLSSSQKAQVNTAANADVASTIQSRGWYLQIKDASPEARALRQSPPMTLWYTDGGSIQKLLLSSIDLE